MMRMSLDELEAKIRTLLVNPNDDYSVEERRNRRRELTSVGYCVSFPEHDVRFGDCIYGSDAEIVLAKIRAWRKSQCEALTDKLNCEVA